MNHDNNTVDSNSAHDRYMAAVKKRSRIIRMLIFVAFLLIVTAVGIFYIGFDSRLSRIISHQNLAIDSTNNTSEEMISESILPVSSETKDEEDSMAVNISEISLNTGLKIKGKREENELLTLIIKEPDSLWDYQLDLGNGVRREELTDTTYYRYKLGGRFMVYLLATINNETVKVDSQYLEIKKSISETEQDEEEDGGSK